MTKFVGIINLTPDSFSDGKRLVNLEQALAQVEVLLAEGADVIDIGAESTNPNSLPLDPDTEWQRLEIFLSEAAPMIHAHNAQVSLDTYHALTVKRALPLGIDWVNDVSAGSDPEMLPIIAANPRLRYVVMHNLGVPANPIKTLPDNEDCLETISRWFASKTAQFTISYGVNKEQLILDPGIGFGKTSLQSWHIMRHPLYFAFHGMPVLFGHSRKSFMNMITNLPYAERDLETAVTAIPLLQAGVDFLRVHNVSMCRRAFNATQMLEVDEGVLMH